MQSNDSQAKGVLAAAFGLMMDEIPDNAGMETFSRWDSLGHMRVIIEVENALGRPLGTEEILSVVDLKSIESLLGQR